MGSRAQRGFSYIEILFSISLFGMGMTGLHALGTVVRDQHVRSREVGAATVIAQTWMERLLEKGYDHLKDWGPIDGYAGPFDARGEPASAGMYSLTWDVQAGVPQRSSKRLIVTVRWETAQRATRVVTLETVVIDAKP